MGSMRIAAYLLTMGAKKQFATDGDGASVASHIVGRGCVEEKSDGVLMLVPKSVDYMLAGGTGVRMYIAHAFFSALQTPHVSAFVMNRLKKNIPSLSSRTWYVITCIPCDTDHKRSSPL